MPRAQMLIVGAGPTGLVLAAELTRIGVEIRIIDKHVSPLELTKSAALHARTLEHFRDLGVAERILAEGQRVDVLTLRTSYRDRLSVDFRVLDDTGYPHMVDIPQNRTEHILIGHLAQLGVPLHRSATLVDLTPAGSEVTARVTTPDGGAETITAQWVVGCDGAVTRRWPGAVDVRLLTSAWQVAQATSARVPVILDRGRTARDLYGSGAAAYLIRPDRHLGYAGPPDRDRIERYLSTVLLDDPAVPTARQGVRHGAPGGQR